MTKTTVFGTHASLSLLQHHAALVQEVWCTKARYQEVMALVPQKKVKTVSSTELDHETGNQNHQGVLVFCRPIEAKQEAFLKKLLSEPRETPLLLLVLDGVQDPHNLGACLRSSNAAGVDAVIIPKDKSVGLTGTVCKVASGAALLTPVIQVTNLAQTLQILKEAGVWVLGASAEAKTSLYQMKLTQPTALVLGAEGTGLRRLTEKRCDVLFSIPMHGAVSSLNVSVATGISVFEAVRQRSV